MTGWKGLTLGWLRLGIQGPSTLMLIWFFPLWCLFSITTLAIFSLFWLRRVHADPAWEPLFMVVAWWAPLTDVITIRNKGCEWFPSVESWDQVPKVMHFNMLKLDLPLLTALWFMNHTAAKYVVSSSTVHGSHHRFSLCMWCWAWRYRNESECHIWTPSVFITFGLNINSHCKWSKLSPGHAAWKNLSQMPTQDLMEV